MKNNIFPDKYDLNTDLFKNWDDKFLTIFKFHVFDLELERTTRQLVLILIFKIGNKHVCNTHRGIRLCNTGYTMFPNII